MHSKADADTYSFLVRPDDMPRGSLAIHVAEQLRMAIVNLQLRPGTMLDKTVISERLGVSRSPISDALTQLQSEGLVDILPQRGSIVSLVSIVAIEEFAFVRKALEVATVKRLCESPLPELLLALEANIEQQQDAASSDDRRRFHRLDLQFHEMMLTALNYRRMKSLVEAARNNLDRARQLTNTVRRVNVGIKEHLGIVAALKSGNAELAASRMEGHLDGMIQEVYTLAREQPRLFADGELGGQENRNLA